MGHCIPAAFVPFLGMLHKQVLVVAGELCVRLRNEKDYMVYDRNKGNSADIYEGLSWSLPTIL